jgi:hypothetical protein
MGIFGEFRELVSGLALNDHGGSSGVGGLTAPPAPPEFIGLRLGNNTRRSFSPFSNQRESTLSME